LPGCLDQDVYAYCLALQGGPKITHHKHCNAVKFQKLSSFFAPKSVNVCI